MIDPTSFQKISPHLKLSHFFLFMVFLVSVRAQLSAPMYSADYLLLPQAKQLMIPINNSMLTKANNGSLQYLKATVKIQLRALNGTYVDAPFQTGNIMVKYWKNQGNTSASSVLSYSYQSISATKRIMTATDDTDLGLFDIEALHNYENQHKFIHSYGSQLSDVLFILGIYRYSQSNLTDLLEMSSINDEIKISVSVFKAAPSELKCSFCSVKTFCPTSQCECYQETYTDCRVARKSIAAKTDAGAKVTDSLTLKVGTISFIQIQPDANSTKELYLTQILMNFDDINSNSSIKINPQHIFFLTYTQNKTDPSYMIPNIYNFDTLDSPSFTNKITSSSLSMPLSPSPSTGANPTNSTELLIDPSGLYVYEKVTLGKNEILTMAVYYLNGTEAEILASPHSQVQELNVQMEMTFGVTTNNSLTEGTVNLALVIGMIALGFFLLLVLICVLHFLVSKRFSVFSIFANSESNRTSIYTGRPRSRKIANMAQQASTLPDISLDFMRALIFKPLKYIYSPHLHQTSNQSNFKPTSLKLTPRDEICSICLEEFTPSSTIKYTYCGHILDSKCIQSWFKKQWSCPMCRQKLQPQDVDEYEEKIMIEVWENEYYQGVLDREVEVVKRLYKQWEGRRRNGNMNGEGTKYTEESLVENGKHKYIQNTIHNISTMQQLQKTIQPIASKKSSSSQSDPESISLQAFPQLINVFQNNHILMKRFIKIYRFYRCVYLYHQINKKFEKDSNLFKEDKQFEEKEYQNQKGEEMRDEREVNHLRLEAYENEVDHNALYVTTRKQMVREQEGQRQQERQHQRQIRQERQQQQPSPRQTRYRYQEQQDLQTNFNTQHKLKSTQSFKRIKNNKQGRAAFHLDFQFIQSEHEQNIPSNQLSEENNIISSLVLQPQPHPVLIREATNSSDQSNCIKLMQDRRRIMSMREEMDGLEREFAQSNKQEKKSDSMNEEMRFREHESILFFQEDIEDARYVQVLSPVVLSPGKLQSRRQQKSNRYRQQMSRRTVQPLPAGKKSPLSDKKKVQSPPNS